MPNTPISTVLQQLDACDQAHVRMALSRERGAHLKVRSLLIDVLPQVWLDNPNEVASGWLGVPIRFEYPTSVFISLLVDSKQIQAWFTDRECSLLGFDRRSGYSSRVLRFEMPELGPEAWSTYCYSFSKTGYVTMPWPCMIHRFNLQGPTMSYAEDFEPLTADDADYFPDFQSARAEIVYGVSDSTQFSSVQDSVAVRIIHADAWLNEIRIGRDRLTAKVSGIQPQGCRVELSGSPQVRQRLEVQSAGTVSLPIPMDLPQQVNIALTRGNDVLDRAV